MGSLYIMISIPSAEHEKVLRIEKIPVEENKKVNSNVIRPIKSTSSMLNHYKCVSEMCAKSNLNHSLSVESLCCSPEVQGGSRPTTPTVTDKSRLPMEKKLENCLEELKIPNAVWVLGKAGKYYQVSFCTAAGEQCERMIQLLNEHEIGVQLNSTVSILPCSLYYEGKGHNITPSKESPSILPSSHRYLPQVKELTGCDRFSSSVRARLMVAQVVEGVKSNAVFTFDFLILLIIAAVTAAIGLVENSVVILVASMLISPLMGPVMASTFGFVIRDWKLQNIGVLNELLGLLLCVLIGFLYGLFIGYLSWESPDLIWPTPEMIIRGDSRSLLVGAMIALLSGGAVAIAVLGNYSGSLTGVAISASLMPPAVNAGLLWALAVIVMIMGDKNPHKLTAFTSGEPVSELMVLGALSLALTFINIVFIFLTGILVLKIKEVSPRDSKDYNKLLWKETIQIARDYNKYNNPQTTECLEEGSTNQLADILSRSACPLDIHQYTWTAYGALQNLNQSTEHNLASVWRTLHNPSITNCYHQAQRKGSPSTHANLARLWSVVNSSNSTYTNLHDKKVVSMNSSQSSSEPGSKRFTVTPTDFTTIK